LRARVEADSIEAKAAADNKSEEIEVDVAVKAKTKSKAKTVKAIKSKATKKEKTPCIHCEKLFVYTDKHEKNCKKNPNIETSQESESIAIKA
jgi:hypothetical protein